MSSIASEYAELRDKVRFYCSNTGELIAEVEAEIESFGFKWAHEDKIISSDEALALAAWIVATFEDKKTDVCRFCGVSVKYPFVVCKACADKEDETFGEKE